jgi:hypothetical protein
MYFEYWKLKTQFLKIYFNCGLFQSDLSFSLNKLKKERNPNKLD